MVTYKYRHHLEFSYGIYYDIEFLSEKVDVPHIPVTVSGNILTRKCAFSLYDDSTFAKIEVKPPEDQPEQLQRV